MRRNCLKSSAREIVHRVPIKTIKIKPNRNPTLRTKISRNKKTFRIGSDQTQLLTEARLATEGNNPVAVMVKAVVSKCFLANAKGDMPVATVS